ncbi:SPRY domain-containing protein [Hirsutella rhossiliensis]|uniref:SPRY domain-containing protein n=1 Tax=Hirsutella rhossiliensis TaxID=111463 RepID=A0A9P8MUH8_9HYPO|nr:SPRY domain-containing protein [Hirsutella rhossiliensis]KAH0962378.1 SPRY domain-containing protein [Hirsutella rhossiliensis]
MCLGRGDKGKGKAAPPPGPSHQWHQQGGDVKDGQAWKPPAGPPPGGHHQQVDYAAPRPPPAGPAPAYDWAGPPRDPPPPIAHDRSHTTNATEAEAEAGENWCRQYPLTTPLVLDEAGRSALRSRNIRLIEPFGFNGRLNWLAKGHWEVKTNNGSSDSCIIGYPPLYVVCEREAATPTTVYYEVKLRADSRHNSVALGFTALPYPSFRMPGWHRGSLAVHGDDGHRFVNDRWGGNDFTTEFRRGDTYGIGMTLTPTTYGKRDVDVFLTHNGVRVGGWDLHEETDAEGDLPVAGLEGFHDLSCAIGTFDGVSVEVILDPEKWMYRQVANGKN